MSTAASTAESTAASSANVILTAAANAGSLEQQNQQRAADSPEVKATDVWTHTVEGLKPPTSLGGALTDLMDATPAGAGVGIGRGLTSDWHHSSWSDTWARWSDMWAHKSQQRDQVAQDAAQIGQARGALQKVGATFAMLTDIEQMVSAPFASVPFPAFPCCGSRIWTSACHTPTIIRPTSHHPTLCRCPFPASGRSSRSRTSPGRSRRPSTGCRRRGAAI